MVKDKSLETLELEIAMMVRGLRSTAAETDESEKLRRAGYFILLLIADKGPLGVKDMSQKLHLDISTVSRQAAPLLEKDLLQKVPSESDRRTYTYEMTEKGREVLASHRENRQDRFHQMISHWDESEIEEFARLLKKFNSLLDSE